MNRWSLATSILLIELALVAVVVVLTSERGPVRLVLGLWFALVAPGWAVLRLIALPMDALTTAATAVGISVSMDALLALALLYAGWWSIEVASMVLLVIVALLVLLDLPMVRRSVGLPPHGDAGSLTSQP